jgi:hypothetical protein
MHHRQSTALFKGIQKNIYLSVILCNKIRNKIPSLNIRNGPTLCTHILTVTAELFGMPSAKPVNNVIKVKKKKESKAILVRGR